MIVCMMCMCMCTCMFMCSMSTITIIISSSSSRLHSGEPHQDASLVVVYRSMISSGSAAALDNELGEPRPGA